MKHTKNRSYKIIAGALTMSMLVSTFTPIITKAEVITFDYDKIAIEEMTERGDYVVYVEDDHDVVKQLDDAQEIVSRADDAVYETDLTQKEVRQLDQREDVEVEENFYFFGAKSKKSKEKKERKKQQKIKRKLAAFYMEDSKDKQGTDWNYQMINIDEMAELTNKSESSVKVAVLDSGIELLSGIPVSESINLVAEEQDLPYYMNDMVGHGTAVADIIHQICPQAELYSVRVLDNQNRGRLSDIVKGIYWCIEQHVDIINMSFGTARESEILKKAIQDAADCGIMIVGSAGNGGSGADVEYPAAFDEVIAVGAVDTSAQKTEESTTGSEVELVVPGSQIMTKSMLGMTTVSSGTSMAAPHVTGAAALLMQQDGEKEAEEIRYILDVSSNPLGETDEYGYGIIDVKHAQELLEDNVEIEDYVFHDKELSVEESVDKRERRTVETFENIDYVEGRWDSNPNHQKLMQAAVDECGGFSATEILLLKAGMIYPDNKKGGLRSDAGHPEWHGKKGENYIANFIFATKIAKAGGVTSNLTKAKGQSKDCYNHMKKAISKFGINGIEWETIIEKQAK